MSFRAGELLTHYEVLAPLGAGAMGEVYRARDTRLGREVAIKVLPAQFAADPERLKRFEREARALASLNHPNLLQIYGVDVQADTFFLALELVPGETLEERLRRGALPLDEALDVARAIAAGLEAAHEAGVIHRDLKPANVCLAPDGRVKVLDFGLAKPTGESKDAAKSTDSVLSTEAGRLLGTPTYMAPEQARGRPIDKRVDVWAFGCVLFECLTARRAFAGDTLTDVFAAVLEREPDWTLLPAATPSRVRELLARCLTKEPRQRLRDVGEARILLNTPDAVSAPNRPAERGSIWRWIAAISTAALVVDFGVRGLPRGSAQVDTASETLREFVRLTDLPGPETHPELSADGEQLLFASAAGGNLDIYTQRVGGSRTINLTSDCTVDDWAPRFSHDGRLVVFRSERDGGGLFLMGATGENARRLTDRGFDPCWSPDDRYVAFTTEPVDNPYQRSWNSRLWVVEVASGVLRKLVDVDAMQPTWSPDGRWLAVWSNPTGQRDLLLVPSAGGQPVSLLSDAPTDWSPEWSPDGSRLYFASDRGGSMNIWSLAIDLETGRPRGAPRAETNGVRNLGYVRLAADGRRLACFAYERTVDMFVYRFTSESESFELTSTLRRQSIDPASLTPDGRWIVGSTTESREDLVLLRADGGELRRLTDDPIKDRTPLCSPDGTTLLFKSTRSGRWQPWTIRLDGSGLSPAGEFGDFDLLGWDRDGSCAYGTDLDSQGPLLNRIVFPVAAGSGSEPAARLAPELGTLACWAPGPRPRSLLGMLNEGHATVTSVGILDTSTLEFSPFAIETGTTANYFKGGVLPDGKRALVLSGRHPVVYEMETGTTRKLAGLPAADGLLVSLDGSTVVLLQEVYDGDVWLGERR